MSNKTTHPKNQENKQNPHIAIVSQYIKDFSLENPHAPNSLLAFKEAPKVDLSLDIDIASMEDSNNTFEVSLNITTSAKNGDMVLFVVELVYAGVFILENIPEEDYEPVLAIHCPNMIFPFARRIISDATSDAGFQPLRIDPIDFTRLYQSKLKERESDQTQGEA